MKKLLAMVTLVLLAVACDSKVPPPGPSPEPTVVPTNNSCRRSGVGADGTLYAGDCAVSPDCRDLGKGEFVGTCYDK